MDLTDKQQAFIEHYLACWNATEAAKRAGYSEKTAYSIGWENLRKPEIRKAIDERLATLSMGANEVLARLTEHAGTTMDDFISSSGRGMRINLKQASERGKLHLVKKVAKTQHGLAIELHDAQAALVQLGRHHKLFVDRTELTGRDGSAIRVEYVNDWRGSAADAPSGAAVGEDASEALQLAGGGAPLEEDDAGDGDRG